MAALEPLREHKNVSDVRGQGLLIGIEFVQDKATGEPFPREVNFAERIRAGAMDAGVLTYPTQGCVDGLRGDHILLAPPFIITRDQCAMVADAIAYALSAFIRVNPR
jgi:adenosylmethionine-8-amino-7-oxononanoate aminotransferase